MKTSIVEPLLSHVVNKPKTVVITEICKTSQSCRVSESFLREDDNIYEK